jgi:predicted nucleic acid-binding protein
VIVLDASAAVELLLSSPLGERVGAKMSDLGGTIHAPHLVDVEVLSAVRRLCAIGDIDVRTGAEVLADLRDLPMERYPHEELLERAWALRLSVTAGDAMYVALAEGLGAVLVTCDGHLARAHGHRVQVELVELVS